MTTVPVTLVSASAAILINFWLGLAHRLATATNSRSVSGTAGTSRCCGEWRTPRRATFHRKRTLELVITRTSTHGQWRWPRIWPSAEIGADQGPLGVHIAAASSVTRPEANRSTAIANANARSFDRQMAAMSGDVGSDGRPCWLHEFDKQVAPSGAAQLQFAQLDEIFALGRLARRRRRTGWSPARGRRSTSARGRARTPSRRPSAIAAS